MSWREQLDVGELTVGKLIMSALLGEATALINLSQSTGESGKAGLKVADTFTLETAGVHKSVQGDCTYDPDSTGFATAIGVSGMATMASGKSFTGGVGYLWGVQGVLNLGVSSTFNNVSSVFAALRGVVVGTTPVMTEAYGICNLYLDNLCTTSLKGLATGQSSFIYCHMNAGGLDSAIRIYGPAVTNLFFLDTCENGGMISDNAETGGTSKKIKVDIDGTTHYVNAYTG